MRHRPPRQRTGRAQERGGPACWEGQSGGGSSVGGGSLGQCKPPRKTGTPSPLARDHRGQASPSRQARGGQGRGAAQQVLGGHTSQEGFINRSLCLHTKKDARTGSVVKNPPANAGQMRDMAWIHGSGRSPRGGNDNPLQCSCLESPMDRGAWWAAVRRVTQSRTAVTEQPTPALVVRDTDTTAVTERTHMQPTLHWW